MTRDVLIKRVGFGAAMLVALAAVLALDAWLSETPDSYWRGVPSAALLLVAVTLGFGEFGRWCRRADLDILSASGYVATVLTACMPVAACILYRASGYSLAVLSLCSVSLAMLVGLWLVFLQQMLRRQTDGALPRIAATMLAVIYLGGGGAMILWIRLATPNIALMVVFLLAVKVTDMAAFFVGSAIGRHKLIPWLSPGKSWEGLLGGLAVSTIVIGSASALLFTWRSWPPSDGLFWKMLLFCFIVGAAGQFGDLCESLLKRSVGTKDSGALVPEFGGVLDIIDSPLLAAPAGYVLVWVLF